MTTPSEYPMALSVNHIAEIMGIGRSKAYEIIQNPKFPVIREGRKVIIPRDAFFRWWDPGYSIGTTVGLPTQPTKGMAVTDKVTDICIHAIADAARRGDISVEELVTWALRTTQF